jgi:hypothetical protein
MECAWFDGSRGERHRMRPVLLHDLVAIAVTAQPARWVSGRVSLLYLFESPSLFFGVLNTDNLRPDGAAWETCVRVRLMHTLVRPHLLDGDGWPRPGKPVNALHTAPEPLFFDAMVLDRLRPMGAFITREESDGYDLIWRYVTRLLGVPGNCWVTQRRNKRTSTPVKDPERVPPAGRRATAPYGFI